MSSNGSAKIAQGRFRGSMLSASLIALGVVLLSFGLASSVNAAVTGDTIFAVGICRVLKLPEGPWGALVASVAGVIGIVSAAVGMYRAALNAVVVCIGAALIRPLLSLFFLSNLNCGYEAAPRPPVNVNSPVPSRGGTGGGGDPLGTSSL